MPQHHARFRNLRHGAVLVMLAVAGYSLWSTVAQGGSYDELSEMRESLGIQESHNQALRQEVEDLRREAYLLRHDERVIERVARSELGLGRPNEVIYVFDRRSRADMSEEH